MGDFFKVLKHMKLRQMTTVCKLKRTGTPRKLLQTQKTLRVATCSTLKMSVRPTIVCFSIRKVTITKMMSVCFCVGRRVIAHSATKTLYRSATNGESSDTKAFSFLTPNSWAQEDFCFVLTAFIST